MMYTKSSYFVKMLFCCLPPTSLKAFLLSRFIFSTSIASNSSVAFVFSSFLSRAFSFSNSPSRFLHSPTISPGDLIISCSLTIMVHHFSSRTIFFANHFLFCSVASVYNKCSSVKGRLSFHTRFLRRHIQTISTSPWTAEKVFSLLKHGASISKGFSSWFEPKSLDQESRSWLDVNETRIDQGFYELWKELPIFPLLIRKIQTHFLKL